MCGTYMNDTDGIEDIRTKNNEFNLSPLSFSSLLNLILLNFIINIVLIRQRYHILQLNVIFFTLLLEQLKFIYL